MNHAPSAKSSVPKTPAKKPQGPQSLQGGTPEANRVAIAILEVLAGGCTPGEAAARLGVSLVRYYQLETRALQGLVSACEPKPMGKQPSPDTRIAALERKLQQAQRECARQQALVRATQRSAGLVPPVKPAKPGGTRDRAGRRKRRPAVRALKAAERLRKEVVTDGPPAVQQEASVISIEPSFTLRNSCDTVPECPVRT
jgi:hypothetical protein